MFIAKTLNDFYTHPALIGSFLFHMGIEGAASTTIHALAKAVIGGEAKETPQCPEGLFCNQEERRATYGFSGVTVMDQAQIASWGDAANKAVAISGALLVSIATASIAKESMLFIGMTELPALSMTLKEIVLKCSVDQLQALVLGQLLVTALLSFDPNQDSCRPL